MRVAITGADGFTGRYVTDELNRRGIDWIALRADLTDAEAVEQAVAAEPFDALIHLAAIAFAGGNDWRSFYTVNQLGSIALFDVIARLRPGTRCVVASSAQVYGPNAAGLLDEDQPCKPANHYALSKYAMEVALSFWNDRLDIVTMRPFNYTGVGQEDRYLVPKIVHHFKNRLDTIELGNISVKRDFGDVRSVAAAYCDMVEAGCQSQCFNIGSGVIHSISEIIQIAETITNHKINIEINPDFVRKNDVPVLGADIGKLRSALPNWQPMNIESTMEWMISG